jgi:tetratricopeptide (TPR) repeat protein
MSLYLMIGLIGLLYIVAFGGLSLFRREGLSIRFAVEALIVTAIAEFLVVVLSIQIHPVLFLLLLYIITLRVRILVDLANIFARRDTYALAERIYNFAARLWPDTTNDLIIKVNHATLLLQKNQLDESISMFKDVLNQADKGYLGVKYESAAHFNLGVAYLRKGNDSMAIIEFNTTIDTWPTSLYSHRAEQALEQQRKKTRHTIENKPVE